jgi:hypothetical protein
MRRPAAVSLFFRLLSFLSAPPSLRSVRLGLSSEMTGEGQDPTARNKANFADGRLILTTVESKGNSGDRLMRLLRKQSQFCGLVQYRPNRGGASSEYAHVGRASPLA